MMSNITGARLSKPICSLGMSKALAAILDLSWGHSSDSFTACFDDCALTESYWCLLFPIPSNPATHALNLYFGLGHLRTREQTCQENSYRGCTEIFNSILLSYRGLPFLCFIWELKAAEREEIAQQRANTQAANKTYFSLSFLPSGLENI